MKIIKYTFALLIASLAGAGPLHAQKDDKKKDPVEMRLNLSVKDAAGQTPDNLKKEDIKIFENGDEQKITHFAKKDGKLNLGIVIDNSGSLRMRLPWIINVVKSLVGNLGEKDEAFMVRFVDTNHIALLQDWSSNKTALSRAADQMYVEGGQSAIIDGLNFAARNMLKRAKDDANERFALVLISDCEERASVLKEKDLLSGLEGSGIQIFVLSLTEDLGKDAGFISASPRDNAEKLANLLAATTGGAAYFPAGTKPSTESINELLKPLLAELRSPYVIGYASPNWRRDGRKRKLRVDIAPGEKGEIRTGFIRESFVVPKE